MPEGPEQRDRRTLLIVDDNEANRELLCALFEQEGYIVSLSKDGAEALAALQGRRFDLVLLDVAMPGLDGFEVLQLVRQRHPATELPVIMATASDRSDDVVLALKLGANDYVTKPFDFPVVLARVETQLSLKRTIDLMRVLERSLAQRNLDLEAANRKVSSAYRKMKRDLEAAARIQGAFLPQALPTPGGLNFAWKFQPCEDLAGDTLNIVPLDEGHLGLYVLDVSGHGVAAALLSVTLSRVLSAVPAASSILLEGGDGPAGYRPAAPAAVIDSLARRFPWDSGTEQYFTIIYGVLDVGTGEFRYASAGHPGLIHLASGASPVLYQVSSFPIGIPVVVEGEGYREQGLRLGAGDRLYLYSDGVTEARNAERELFGTERLLKLIERSRHSSLEESSQHITEELRKWSGSSGLKDDLSILAVEYLREGE
jgi:sigma-B regulation protein RsbU (phosphoserine phosphatase)